MIKAKIYVTLKPSVLDPQGKVITDAIHTLGYTSVSETRASKFFEMTFDSDDKEAVSKQVEEICHKLLANPNTEIFRYEV